MSEHKTWVAGIIGAGMIARVHLANLQKTGRVSMKWIAARDPGNMEEVRSEFGLPMKTSDYRDILADPEVEVVIITTPPDLHREMFVAALRAGKNVLLEKPMALNLEEADEMLEVKSQHPELVAMECSGRHSRLIPKYWKVRELISSGMLGEIYAIHHNCVSRQSRPGIEYHPAAKWFLDKSVAGGGPLLDWGVYDLGFHLGVLGDRHEVELVKGVKLMSGLDDVDPGTDIYDVEEHFILNLQLSGGISYYWERGGHANMEVPNETRIYGTRGGVMLGFNSWDDQRIFLFSLDEDNRACMEDISIDYKGHDDNYAMSEHLVRVLDGEEAPVISMETARKHLEIIFRCYANTVD